jgi:hypothetical protein
MSEIIAAGAPARRVPHLRPKVFALAPRLAAVALAATLLGGTSLAFAGALPGPAQDAVHTAFSHIGVSVPRAHHATPKPHPSNKSGSVSGVVSSPANQKDDGRSKQEGHNQDATQGNSDGTQPKNDDGKSGSGADQGDKGQSHGGENADQPEGDHGSGDGSQASKSPSPLPTDGHGRDGGVNEDQGSSGRGSDGSGRN